MARVVNPTFTGIEMNNARPGSYATDLDSETIAKDQAYTYETLTNQPVPGAGSVTAVAPHDHSISKTTGPTTSENTGALIRIGWVTQYLNARLFVRDSNPTPAHPLFVPFYWSPVYIPPGTDSVMVGMICPDISGEFKDRRAARFRLRVYDSSINEMPNSPTTFRDATINDVFYLGGSSGFDFLISKIGSSTIDFKAGGVFLFRIDCWDGLTKKQFRKFGIDRTFKRQAA